MTPLILWSEAAQRPLVDGRPATLSELHALATDASTASSLGHHALEQFQTCNKAAQLGTMRGLRSRTAAIPLMVGSGFHYSVHALYGHPITPQEAAELGAAAAYAHGTLASDTKEEDRVAAATQVMRIVTAYGANYPRAAEPFEVIACEMPFIIPELDNYTGRIDGVIRWKQPHQFAGRYFVREFKTTADKDEGRYLQRYLISRDLTGYMVGAMRVLDVPLSGVMMDVAVKEEPPRFWRANVLRSPEDVKRWMDETVQIIEQMRGCQRTGVWPRNTSMCNSWGGFNRPCVFKPVCLYGDDERITRALFSEREKGPA